MRPITSASEGHAMLRRALEARLAELQHLAHSNPNADLAVSQVAAQLEAANAGEGS